MLHATTIHERERERSNSHGFRLSHLMPNAWFYKLRDMKRPRPASQRNSATTRTSKRSSDHYYHGTTTPKPLPLSPHQSYPYLQTKQTSLEKLHVSPLHLNPKATDIQFPIDHHHHHHSPRSGSAIVIDNDFEDLQLRPIRTRTTSFQPKSIRSTIASDTCPSSPRLRSRRLHVLSGSRVSTTSTSRRRSVPRRSFAVVKATTDPSKDFRESMVEMIVGNDMRTREDLEDLLECYLSLNSREYHGVIMEVFRGIWLEITDDTVERRG